MSSPFGGKGGRVALQNRAVEAFTVDHAETIAAHDKKVFASQDVVVLFERLNIGLMSISSRAENEKLRALNDIAQVAGDLDVNRVVESADTNERIAVCLDVSDEARVFRKCINDRLDRSAREVRGHARVGMTGAKQANTEVVRRLIFRSARPMKKETEINLP
ncbi:MULTISPECIES: hypothetical protein [unclassified Neorhizobium]|uniref:hypothetical protein n=1 Tax=unclassified Neorhizobium TaxID=2629175 RepID=UPI001FF3EE11|nr:MULTISPECIES: hypothetical protein [unclassified Neorhizobium]MCJ9671591.1 hypothetical protein [Neorhizobium sp. SHOUNA12B]MCJ9747720.1 hypothetical protein [Neorhizobium sp. SHOUNA12A]